MMYAQSKGIYYVQVSPKPCAALRHPALRWVWSVWVPFLSPSPSLLTPQLEDDIVAKPNYLSTMKNFALQQPSEDWMILEFSQLGFIGVPLPLPDGAFQSHLPLPSCLPVPLCPL